MQTVELVIMAVPIVVFLLVVVAFGRYAHGKQLVEQAAYAAVWSAANATTPQDAADRAVAAGRAALDSAGVSCRQVEVRTDAAASFAPGATISVTVSCTASLSDLALAGLPGSSTVTATASAPLELRRMYGGGR